MARRNDPPRYCSYHKKAGNPLEWRRGGRYQFSGRRETGGGFSSLPKHNRAALVAYRHGTGRLGESSMRLFFGIIIGCLLTVGGAYVTDAVSPAGAKPMVNWDVVAKNLDNVTTLAREGWKKITG